MKDQFTNGTTAQSDESACSGADARQADKACFATTEDGRPIDISPEGKLVIREAAVSPRSSDGLLPCPFCGNRDLDTSNCQDNERVCWVSCRQCGANGPTGVLSAFAKEAWNTRGTDQFNQIMARLSVIESRLLALEASSPPRASTVQPLVGLPGSSDGEPAALARPGSLSELVSWLDENVEMSRLGQRIVDDYWAGVRDTSTIVLQRLGALPDCFTKLKSFAELQLRLLRSSGPNGFHLVKQLRVLGDIIQQLELLDQGPIASSQQQSSGRIKPSEFSPKMNDV